MAMCAEVRHGMLSATLANAVRTAGMEYCGMSAATATVLDRGYEPDPHNRDRDQPVPWPKTSKEPRRSKTPSDLALPEWRGHDLNLRPSRYRPPEARLLSYALVGVRPAQSHFSSARSRFSYALVCHCSIESH